MDTNPIYDTDGGNSVISSKINKLEKVAEEADLRRSVHEVTKMAVMKTCCGCLSTRSGTMTILMVAAIGYIATIVFSALDLGEDGLEKRIREAMVDDDDCKTGEHKDTWWCDALYDIRDNADTLLIVGIALSSVFLVLAVLAIFGTSKGKQWFIMPWIVAKFVLLLVVCVICVIVVIVMSVYKPDSEDSSTVIAVGVIVAIQMAFLFYLWLCVVSHFQVLRELDKQGLLDKVHDVQPFHGEGVTAAPVMVYDGHTLNTDDGEEDEDEDNEKDEDDDDDGDEEDNDDNDDDGGDSDFERNSASLEDTPVDDSVVVVKQVNVVE